jgi:hypothetical protein
MSNKSIVNTEKWWNEYFCKNWDKNHEREQTGYFVKSLINNIHKNIFGVT